jgi:hypothetical protein
MASDRVSVGWQDEAQSEGRVDHVLQYRLVSSLRARDVARITRVLYSARTAPSSSGFP